MEVRVFPWTDESPPAEEAMRTELEEQELRVYRWSNDPDDAYPNHTHGYHKVIYVVDGSIRFDLPTRNEKVNLKTGDRFELPSGIRHSATVGPDGVTCLEAHIY